MQKSQTFFLATALFALASSKPRPNIVFILTDDQDVQLGGMTPLKYTKKLIADEGITFTNAFATTPICCPSRSSILTGLYVHSHGTFNNTLSGGCSNRRWQSLHENETFGAVLHKAGYRTFYAGKYLNRYGSKRTGGVRHIPKGWDWWIGLVGNSVYYNYTLSVNGSGVFRGHEESDYLTDVLKDYSLAFLNQRQSQEKPFLMVVATPSPHEPFTPANRHKGKFADRKAPRTPSFNLPVNKTKHWLLRLPPDVLAPETVKKIDEAFRNRWESLLSVDELVQAIVLKLQALRVLNNTYVIFSSDHGFHLGQFGLPWDKRQPYETDVRIPLVVRGPEMVKKTSSSPVLNIDFAATILDMAETGVKKYRDGKSFLSHVNSPPNEPTSRTFMIEYRGEGHSGENKCYHDPNLSLCIYEMSCKCFDAKNNTYNCVRRLLEDSDDVYCEFKDDESFREFYDIRADPHQINNLAGKVGTETHKRILDCCEKMIRLKKAVDKCFGLPSGELGKIRLLEPPKTRQRMRLKKPRTQPFTSSFLLNSEEPRGFPKADKKKLRRDFFLFFT